MTNTIDLPERSPAETYAMNEDKSIIGEVHRYSDGHIRSREYRVRSEDGAYYNHGIAFHYDKNGYERKSYHDHGVQMEKWKWWWNTNKKDLQNFRFDKLTSPFSSKHKNNFDTTDPRFGEPLRVTLSCAIGTLCHKLEKKPSFMDRFLGKQKIRTIRMD